MCAFAECPWCAYEEACGRPRSDHPTKDKDVEVGDLVICTLPTPSEHRSFVGVIRDLAPWWPGRGAYIAVDVFPYAFLRERIERYGGPPRSALVTGSCVEVLERRAAHAA